MAEPVNMNFLMTPSIDEAAVDYLQRIGRIFAEFNAQDSGNVSYGVRIGSERYFVKTAGRRDSVEPVLTFEKRSALLRNAARLAESCRHPALPALHGVIESPEGPLLVYRWADGELLGVPRAVRHDPTSAFQRFRHLPPGAIVTALDTLYSLHRELVGLGWIAVDFYDGSLIYNFETGDLAVVDLDLYHRGPFRNDRGRMFGSTRFMAPEEFELGALIDERTNVYVMGRTAAVFLSDGSLDFEPFRGSPALHRVVAKACDPEPARRYGSIAEFHDAWLAAGVIPTTG